MKITECIIKEYESLAEFFNRFMDHAEENNLEEITVDDYFDAANVSNDARNDFAFASILAQAQDLLEEK